MHIKVFAVSPTIYRDVKDPIHWPRRTKGDELKWKALAVFFEFGEGKIKGKDEASFSLQYAPFRVANHAAPIRFHGRKTNRIGSVHAVDGKVTGAVFRTAGRKVDGIVDGYGEEIAVLGIALDVDAYNAQATAHRIDGNELDLLVAGDVLRVEVVPLAQYRIEDAAR